MSLDRLPIPAFRARHLPLRIAAALLALVTCARPAAAAETGGLSFATAQRLPAIEAVEPEGPVAYQLAESPSLEGAAPSDESGVEAGAVVVHDADWAELIAAGAPSDYRWWLLPNGIIYRNYLAGAKEPRLRAIHSYGKDEGHLWDASLGGKISLLRYGNNGLERPEGIELQLEGAALLRLDPAEERDVDAVDFRIGLPIVWGDRVQQTKFGYYHLSAHLADEFMLKHPGFPRLNYSRDVLVWGKSYYLTPRLRVYGEVGYAVIYDVSEPWEFQFGLDYSPYFATGLRGAPFFALNGHLREEVDFGGNFVAQAGWAWRGSPASGLLRCGVDYYNGKSDQFSFYDYYESKVGFAIWYDY